MFTRRGWELFDLAAANKEDCEHEYMYFYHRITDAIKNVSLITWLNHLLHGVPPKVIVVNAFLTCPYDPL